MITYPPSLTSSRMRKKMLPLPGCIVRFGTSMLLPYQQTNDQNLTLLQNKWIPLLNPLLSAPTAGAIVLSNVPVVTGVNVINHKLQAKLQGYIVIMNSAAITYHDNQSSNQTPQLTLNLVASGPATLSILVF